MLLHFLHFHLPWRSYVARSQGWQRGTHLWINSLILSCLLVTPLQAGLFPPVEKACDLDRPDGLLGGDFDEFSRVRYVHDGDTLHLNGGRKVRLIGINTPELARKQRPAEPFAQQAKQALKSLLDGSDEIALIYGKDRTDRYGRLLAHVFLDNGINVQAALLEQGLASALIIPPNTRFMDCYLEKEREARCDDRGLWQQQGLIDASAISKKDKGYHLVAGKVRKIDFDDRGIWLNLDHKLTVGIRDDELYLFDRKTLKSLIDKDVIVRGWINKKPRNLPQKTAYYMRIKHPLAIQPAEQYRCEAPAPVFNKHRN